MSDRTIEPDRKLDERVSGEFRRPTVHVPIEVLSRPGKGVQPTILLGPGEILPSYRAPETEKPVTDTTYQ